MPVHSEPENCSFCFVDRTEIFNPTGPRAVAKFPAVMNVWATPLICMLGPRAITLEMAAKTAFPRGADFRSLHGDIVIRSLLARLSPAKIPFRTRRARKVRERFGALSHSEMP